MSTKKGSKQKGLNCVLGESRIFLAHVSPLYVFFLLVTRHVSAFQVVREEKKKVISFASELKKLTSRSSRSMTTGSGGGGGGVDGPAQSKDDRAACCVALTELQE